MKRLGLVLLFAFIGISFWGFTKVVSAEKKQSGSIIGVVEEREQTDGDQTMAIDLKSADKLAFRGVTIKLTKKLNDKVRVMGKPEGCKTEKDKEKLNFEDCPPAFAFKVGLEFPPDALNEFNKFTRKKLEIEYLTNSGKEKQKFDVKKTAALTPQKPEDTAFIPASLRPGYEFSITPKNGFKDGDWTLFVVDKDGKETKVDGRRLPERETDWSFYAENKDELDKIGKALKAEYDLLNTPEKEKSGLEKIFQDLLKRIIGAEGRADKQAKENVNKPRFFSLPLDASGRVKFKYKNYFGEVPVDDFSDTYLIKDKSPQNLAAPPKITECTKRIFQGGELCVCGFFPSEFSRRRLLLDGKPLGAPMSGSTDSVIVLPKNLSPGKHVITWDLDAFGKIGDPDIGFRQKPSASDRVEFLVLGVQASIDQNKLFTGQGTTLRLKIIGTEEKLPIELENKTPDIVNVEGGTKQVIMTSGGANNTLERKVRGTQRGNFDIKYKLDGPSCPCNRQEEGGGMTDVKPPPPGIGLVGDDKSPVVGNKPKESDYCRKLRESCEKKELKVRQIRKRRQKEIDDCAKLPESERKGCLDRVKLIYDSFLAEAEKEFEDCKSLYKLCLYVENAPQPESTEENILREKKKRECLRIKALCDELIKQKNHLRTELSEKKSECAKKAKNKSERDACYAELNDYFRPKIKQILEKLEDCRKRFSDCEKFALGDNFRNTSGNENPRSNESKDEKPKNCDELKRECLLLERKLRNQENDLIRSLRECDTNNPNDIAKADACRKKEKEFYQPGIDKLKKQIADCKARLAKCNK